MQKLNISTLQDPRDYLDEHGESALVGLYLQVYWESLALGDAILDMPLPVYSIKELHSYENWLGIAAELLPEWATEFLAHYDSLLEGE